MKAQTREEMCEEGSCNKEPMVIKLAFKCKRKKTIGFSQNANDAKEVMKQNLLTVQQILSSFVSLNDLISNENFNIYSFQNRKFQVGQWVDIKDSTDQWVFIFLKII